MLRLTRSELKILTRLPWSSGAFHFVSIFLFFGNFNLDLLYAVKEYTSGAVVFFNEFQQADKARNTEPNDTWFQGIIIIYEIFNIKRRIQKGYRFSGRVLET